MPEQSQVYNLDSLLLSAFKTHSPVEKNSPELNSSNSLKDSATSCSPLEITYPEDTELDSVMTGDSFSITPVSVVLPSDQQSQTHESCLNEKMSTRESITSSVVYDKDIRVWEAQLNQEPWELLTDVSFDITALSATPSFSLMITSRGSIVAQLEKAEVCPIESGLTSIPSSQRLGCSLVPGIQLERALRGKRFVSVASGDCFSVALSSAGEVYTWGRGDNGELGLSDVNETPDPMVCVKLLNVGVVKIACGGHHTLALDAHGRVYSWGLNNHGQLGHGDTVNRFEPIIVRGLSRVWICAVCAGEDFSLCIDNKGRAYGFGRNEVVGMKCFYYEKGQCGFLPASDCLLPTAVRQFPSEVCSVSCGIAHTIALCKNGEVMTWGCGAYGEMGVDYALSYATSPQQVPLSRLLHKDEWISIVRAGGHRCAVLTTEGRVFTWGANEQPLPCEFISQAIEGRITDIVLTSTSTFLLQDTHNPILGCPALPSPPEHITSESKRNWRFSRRNLNDEEVRKERSQEKTRLVSMEWWVSIDVVNSRALSQRQLERAWIEELDNQGTTIHASHTLDILIEKGIPPRLRVRIWPLLLGNVLKITPETFNL